jgi:hypothetical protein
MVTINVSRPQRNPTLLSEISMSVMKYDIMCQVPRLVDAKRQDVFHDSPGGSVGVEFWGGLCIPCGWEAWE